MEKQKEIIDMVRRSRLRAMGRMSKIRRKGLPPFVKKDIGKMIGEEVRAGYPRKQAIAIAFSRARMKYPKYVVELSR